MFYLNEKAIVKIDEDNIDKTDDEGGNKDFFTELFWRYMVPIHCQPIGKCEKDDHRHQAKQHKLERHGMIQKSHTDQRQCHHITDDGTSREKLGEIIQHKNSSST